ncbi:MAG: hypothetical protein FJ090_19765, partial [Deltaproteobacteria bacterium]|nr:hypothetical protein [Deltaproteobacteria bacterium]
MFLLLSVTRALAWPADDSIWATLTLGGAEFEDVYDDHDRLGVGLPDGIDCVGDLAVYAAPALYWWTNGDDIFLRVRVDDSPWITEDEELHPASWNFLLETDGDPTTYEYLAAVTGPATTVQLWHNDAGLTGADATPTVYLDSWLNTVPEEYARSNPASSAIHTLEDWFVDVRVPVEALPTAEFIGDTFRVAFVSGYGGAAGGEIDLCGTDDGAALGDLESAWSDEIGIDRDDDGLTDLDEENRGTAIDDADSDDDGLSDGEEVDTYGTEPLDCDTDGDGLADGLEAGRTEAGDDTDTSAGCFEADGDPATITDPAVADTDGGGMPDGAEDRDGDGAIDDWETNPNDPTDDVDADGDGIADSIEDECDGSGDDNDRDGDGVPDAEEGLDDSDGDGIPDFCEEDDDGDGIPTVDEGTADSDGDGTPDNEDTDSDDDGTPDSPSDTGDSDCDGIADYQDTDDTDGDCADADADGVTNADERACGSDPENPDTDGDGLSDYEDSCD